MFAGGFQNLAFQSLGAANDNLTGAGAWRETPYQALVRKEQLAAIRSLTQELSKNREEEQAVRDKIELAVLGDNSSSAQGLAEHQELLHLLLTEKVALMKRINDEELAFALLAQAAKRRLRA